MSKKWVKSWDYDEGDTFESNCQWSLVRWSGKNSDSGYNDIDNDKDDDKDNNKDKDNDKDNDHLWEDHGKDSDGSDNDKREGAIILFLLTNVEPNSYQNIVWWLFWGIQGNSYWSRNTRCIVKSTYVCVIVVGSPGTSIHVRTCKSFCWRASIFFSQLASWHSCILHEFLSNLSKLRCLE